MSWRDQILKELILTVKQIILVADPDELLLEEGILREIQARDFELFSFEDSIAFRYIYESKFRSRWDRGEKTPSLIVRITSQDLDCLPYDLLQIGRKLSFNLGSLFPKLSYSVVAAIDRTDYDILYEAQNKYLSKQLGDYETKDFILRHAFNIALELIKEPRDLLRVLLRRHYRCQQIPHILDEYIITVLRKSGLFNDWPLEEIIPNREAFFSFLQERWPVFLNRLIQSMGITVREGDANYKFTYKGPAHLPFDDVDVRIYIDNLFLEGFLQPVPHAHAEIFSTTWAAHGVITTSKENRYRRIEGLLNSIEETLPTMEARYKDWFSFAHRWAELIALEFEPNATVSSEHKTRLDTLRSRIDSVFCNWVINHFAGLVNLPPIPPVMLHHIPRYLARHIESDPRTKIAFLVLDGLSLDQWIAMREVLKELDSTLLFRESTVFAWIPTITSVSRQAAFAGIPPVYFPKSIYSTDREPRLWTQFWVNQGLAQHEVAYDKGLGDGDLERVSELLCQPRLRVIGLVIDKVDRIMHGMELGSVGMHNQILQWVKQGFIRELLSMLHDHGFQIYLASDHGNIEAKGIGRPSEGVIADLRGERVRVYSDSKLRAQIKAKFPESLEWPPIGLPENYLALIASDRKAFVRTGETVVAHGGITIEELLVPFVEIKRRT